MTEAGIMREADIEAETGSEAESDTEEDQESETDSETESEGALLEQTLTAEVDDIIVTLSGLLPDNAQVSVIPVDVSIEDRQVLLALDITIFDGNGEIFEPENDTVTVMIESAGITEEALVYYVPDDGAPQELSNNAQEGSVVFEAEHFSTYAVTTSEVSESDTVIASGTMANAAGTENEITWVLTAEA
ncbi:MAG: hypothetical protein LUF30_04675, partial [Lachnospiraceae bacterium]|nr:hypothetical protein [Lachnospiraceae bacterium]